MTTERRITRQTEQILETLMSDSRKAWSGSQIAPVAGLKSGTLYPALLRMQRSGCLTCRWEDIDPSEAGRPRRRLYALTGEGERVARQIASEADARARRRQRRDAASPLPGGLPA